MMPRKVTTIFIIILCFAVVFFSARRVKADQKALEANITGGLDKTAKTAEIPTDTVDKTDPGATVAKIVGQIVGVILSFVGAIFLVLTVWGGFLWMTSGGNEEQTGKAKKIIMSATVGLFLVLAAYAVSYFVVQSVGKETINAPQAASQDKPLPPLQENNDAYFDAG